MEKVKTVLKVLSQKKVLAAIITLITACGVAISPEMQDTIVTAISNLLILIAQ